MAPVTLLPVQADRRKSSHRGSGEGNAAPLTCSPCSVSAATTTPTSSTRTTTTAGRAGRAATAAGGDPLQRAPRPAPEAGPVARGDQRTNPESIRCRINTIDAPTTEQSLWTGSQLSARNASTSDATDVHRQPRMSALQNKMKLHTFREIRVIGWRDQRSRRIQVGPGGAGFVRRSW